MGNQKHHHDGQYRRPYAKKSLGQNFLADPSYSQKIVSALGILGEDTVLEIGPGRGALTGLLAERAGRVVAVEIDRDLVSVLRDQFRDLPSVEIIEADFLDILPTEVLGDQVVPGSIKVAANLPYYISTAILRKLFDHRHLFSRIVVMLQKEVALRLAAQPGTSDRGFLTVLVEHGFDSEVLFDVPAGAFRPVPKVESAVVSLTPKSSQPAGFDELLVELASAGFRQKRKTLRNNLRSATGRTARLIESAGGAEALIGACGIEPNARAEDLSCDQWRALAREVS